MSATDRTDIERHIRTAFDSLSESQQRVAEFVLLRSSEAIYLSAARIAEITSVSHSTVVRMAQALGFDGFPEFQSALQERFLNRMSAVERLRYSTDELTQNKQGTSGVDEAGLLQQIMMADATQIQHLAHTLSMSDFKQAVAALTTARRVFIIGLRGSTALAHSLWVGLRYIRPNNFLLHANSSDLPDQLVDLADGDLLVTMSYGRYMRDTLAAMVYARSRGIPVLTVTDSTLSPAARRASIVLVAPTRIGFYVASAAPYSLMGALLNAVALRCKPDNQARLQQLDQLAAQFYIFDEHLPVNGPPPDATPPG